MFDSTGLPVVLVDELEISRFRGGSAVVLFRQGQGFRQYMVADSAAVMARVLREGLGVLDEAVRQGSRIQQEPLDSLDLRRATALAEYLWTKRCS